MPSQTTLCHAFTDDVLETLDATGIAEQIARGELSIPDVIEAAIARADKVNPSIHAIVTPSFEKARERAQNFKRNENGKSQFFSGLPTFIKDNDLEAGVVTTWGSNSTAKIAAQKSDRIVRLFESLGFLSLGKSAMPEFGFTGTTEPLNALPARNPWNLEHSTGGSSGGAAALVAAGVVPLAHGNDGGGSIRIPASCCGLVGLKPSRGRLPQEKHHAQLPVRIIAQGVLTRTVRDTVHFYQEAEKIFYNSRLPRMAATGKPKSLKIAFFTDFGGGHESDPEVTKAAERTAELCEELGHQVTQIKNPYPASYTDEFLIYWSFLAFATVKFGRTVYGKDFDPKALEPFTKGLSRFYQRNLMHSMKTLVLLKSFPIKYNLLMKGYDVYLSPTMAKVPPKIGVLRTDGPFDDLMEKMRSHFPFTPAQNVSGAPAISLPMGRSQEGLPIGMHFAARMGQENLLLSLAAQLEEASPFDFAPKR